MNTNPSILFRCDGSPEIGLGHVVRCLALADELYEVHGCRVAFAMRRGPLGFEMVRQKRYPVLTPPDDDRPFDYARWLAEAIGNVNARVLILDVRDDLPRAAVEALKEQGLLIVTQDDPSERRLAADLAFYPPVPQARKLDWSGFSGKVYVGWEWVVLRREFASCPRRMPHERPVVLVAMGGSDPAGLTLRVIEALDLLDEDFEAIIVLGPGFHYNKDLKDLLTKTRRQFEVRRSVTDVPELMAQADLAVASFGVTAYELAAMGIPAIYLCLTEDHAESASAFMDAGIAISLGVFSRVTAPILAETVSQLLNDVPRRLRMSDQAKRRVDGKGTKRIAHEVAEVVKSTNG